MKRRTLSLVLACALSVALLSACGGKGSDGSVSGSSSGSLLPDGSVSSSASEGPAQPDASAPDQSQPDASSPDGSQPDAVQEPSAAASLSLNKNSFTLSKAGATYRLKYTLSPEGGKVTFSSSDEKVDGQRQGHRHRRGPRLRRDHRDQRQADRPVHRQVQLEGGRKARRERQALRPQPERPGQAARSGGEGGGSGRLLHQDRKGL